MMIKYDRTSASGSVVFICQSIISTVKLEISIIYYTFEAIRRKYKFKKPYRSKIILERLILMNTLSNIISGDYSTRGLVLGRYYPITYEEAETLIRKGLGKDLINFVSDRGYTFLYLIMI